MLAIPVSRNCVQIVCTDTDIQGQSLCHLNSTRRPLFVADSCRFNCPKRVRHSQRGQSGQNPLAGRLPATTNQNPCQDRASDCLRKVLPQPRTQTGLSSLREGPALAPLPNHLRGWHSLRHYAITRLISASINPDYVRQFAGHSTLTETLNTYSGWWPSDADDARLVLAEALAATRISPNDQLRRSSRSS